jgi:hypothetical protein
MIGAVVIKAEYIAEAKAKYGQEMVDAMFGLLKGQHPDEVLSGLDGDERKCFLIIMKNRYPEIETKN